MKQNILLLILIVINVCNYNAQNKSPDRRCGDYCKGVYAKSETKEFPKLKKHAGVLTQKASNTKDTKGLKQGLWSFTVKSNTHYGSYTCLDTVNHGGHIPFRSTVKIIATGNFKNSVPIGVWIKSMEKFDRTYYEYFFLKKGECVKHIYFDHHNCIYKTDTLTAKGKLTFE